MKKKERKVLPEEEQLLAAAPAEEKEAEGEEETAPQSEAANEEAEKTPEPEAETEKESETDAEKEKVREDIALFRSLFPQVGAKEIPDEVWQRVEKGESLAASYALYFIQSVKEKEHIHAVNTRNEKTAPPKIKHDGAENDYFSPDAVKGMTRAEIKKNYHAILRSMDKWN